MSEELEVGSEELHETIREELEREGGPLVRRVALTTALFAALGAIASLLAGSTVNEALVLKNDASRLQSQASDQWAYYQAKGIKSAVQEAMVATWRAAGREVPPQIVQTMARSNREQAGIEQAARELERTRDEKSNEADHLLHRHHVFAQAVAMLQVAIALGAIAALTRIRAIWIGSCVVGLAGLGMLVWPYVR
jgi:hypothetical protein